ncbi:DUF1328 domain-containing protein [Microbulbifer sp. 2304DJ12-6]|uniref:DUF1328 domain-containing protein n=1 Tax=Microbulbifer sp. 2304DJ12-6 TaxID=3233340 RepID=UPI0039AF7D50
MHEHTEQFVAALPVIRSWLIHRGFRFVTLAQIAKKKDKEHLYPVPGHVINKGTGSLAGPSPAIRSRSLIPGADTMLRWAVAFLVIALIAAFFGFSGIATTAAEIAKILFFIFIVLFILVLIFGKPRPPK